MSEPCQPSPEHADAYKAFVGDVARELTPRVAALLLPQVITALDANAIADRLALKVAPRVNERVDEACQHFEQEVSERLDAHDSSEDWKFGPPSDED